MTIWIVLGIQGPIQAFEDQSEAEEFAQQLGNKMLFRVVSCALKDGEAAVVVNTSVFFDGEELCRAGQLLLPQHSGMEFTNSYLHAEERVGLVEYRTVTKITRTVLGDM